MSTLVFKPEHRVSEKESELMVEMNEVAADQLVEIHVMASEGLYRVNLYTNEHKGLPKRMDFLLGERQWTPFISNLKTAWNTWSYTASPIHRQMASKGFPYVDNSQPEEPTESIEL